MESCIIVFNGLNSENLTWFVLSGVIVAVGVFWFFYRKMKMGTFLNDTVDPNTDYRENLDPDEEHYDSSHFAGAMGHSLKKESPEPEIVEAKASVAVESIDEKSFDANKFPQVVGGLVKDFRFKRCNRNLSVDSSKMFLPFEDRKIASEEIIALVSSLVPDSGIPVVVEEKKPARHVRRFCSSFTAKMSCEDLDGEGIHNLKTHFWNMSRKNSFTFEEEKIYGDISRILAIHGVCLIPS